MRKAILVDETPATNRSASGKRWLVFFAVSLLAIVFILWFFPHGSSKVQERIDAIRRAGYPVSMLDLAKVYPPLPDNQNSVVIYQKAFSHYISPSSSYTNWPVFSAAWQYPFTPLPPDIKEDMAGFIAKNQTTLGLLHQAAAIENSWFDDGFTNANGMPTSFGPRFVSIRQCAQLLALTAILQSENRQSMPAAETILDSLALARSMNRDPMLVPQMIRAACLQLSCTTLEFALSRNAFSDADLRRLQAALAAAQTSGSFKLSVAYERCMAISYHDKMLARPFLGERGETLEARLNDIYFRVRYYRESDFITYLDLVERHVTAAKMPYPKQLEAVKQLHTETTNFADTSAVFGMFTPNWKPAFETYATAIAKLSLGQTALAIERYHLANHDQFPGTLQDLVPAYLPAVPADPFDGKPLRYNRLPKGYLIYSIGKDYVDNGGAEWNTTNETGDITFTVQR